MKQRSRAALGFAWLWTRIAFRWAKPRVMALKARLTPHAPRPVRFLVELFPYEPRPAIALGILAVLVVVTMGYGGITAIAYKQGVAGTVGLLLIFAVIGIGWGGIVTVPIAWSRLWMRLWDITPHGIAESWTSPTLRGKYMHDPRFYDVASRTLIRVNPAKWGDDQLAWALEAYGPNYASGEIPMDFERSERRMTPVDVINAADARRTVITGRTPTQEWEKPVAVGLMVVLIIVSLFLALALLSSPNVAGGAV